MNSRRLKQIEQDTRQASAECTGLSRWMHKIDNTVLSMSLDIGYILENVEHLKKILDTHLGSAEPKEAPKDPP